MIRRRVRVLVLVDTLALGGGETVAAQLAVALKERGNKVAICASRSGGPLLDEVRAARIPVYLANRRSRSDIIGLWGVVKAINEFKPDVLHTHMYGSNMWGRILRPMSRIPVLVAHDHGSTYAERRARALLDRLTRGLADTIVTPSQYDRASVIRETGIEPTKVRVIYNGTPELGHATRELRNDLGLDSSAYLFGAVGGIRPVKGYRYLLAAFNEVANELPYAHLVIVGNGSEKSALKEEARQLGLNGRVHLPGSIENAATHIPEFDTFVNSSISEGLPLSILNAMSASRPIIASSVGGVPEAISHGVTGLLVAPQSVDGLTESMLRIAKDKSLGQRLGSAARNSWKSRFTREQMVCEVESLYDELLRRRTIISQV